MNEGNKHRQVGHDNVSDTAEGLGSGIDSFTAIKQYLPYDDYVKEWLVAATTLRNEQEYLELHRDEILNYCNGSANEKKKRFKSYEDQRAERRKKRMSKLRRLYGLHTPSSNFFGKAVASPTPNDTSKPKSSEGIEINCTIRTGKVPMEDEKENINRPLSPIFLQTEKEQWEPRRSRTPTRFGFDEEAYEGKYHSSFSSNKPAILNPPMTFNNNKYTEGYTNKMGVKQKENLRKGKVEHIEPSFGEVEAQKLEEKGSLHMKEPDTPPPIVESRLLPLSAKQKVPGFDEMSASETTDSATNIVPSPNLNTSGNLEMEVDELLDWVDGLDENNL